MAFSVNTPDITCTVKKIHVWRGEGDCTMIGHFTHLKKHRLLYNNIMYQREFILSENKNYNNILKFIGCALGKKVLDDTGLCSAQACSILICILTVLRIRQNTFSNTFIFIGGHVRNNFKSTYVRNTVCLIKSLIAHAKL